MCDPARTVPALACEEDRAKLLRINQLTSQRVNQMALSYDL